MRITRRQLINAATLAGAAAWLAGCNADAGVHAVGEAGSGGSVPLGSLPADRSYHSVAMIGDSITRASTPALEAAFGGRGFTDITIDAEVSRRIEVGDGKGEPLSGDKVLYSMLAKGMKPDVWVIALGTNDVGSYPDAPAYQELIDRLLTMPPENDPIVWVDVYRPQKLDDTEIFNLLLQARTAERGNARVVSWFAKASDPAQKILRKDKVHPNDAGTLVFADVVASAF